MLTRVLLGAHRAGRLVTCHFHRNLGVSAVMAQKAAANLDPIQRLFVEKIKQYSEKSRTSGGKLVDATPEVERQLQEEIERIEKQYNAKSVDMTKFPEFSFKDIPLDPVGTGIEVKDQEAKAADAAVVETEDPDLKPYWEV